MGAQYKFTEEKSENINISTIFEAKKIIENSKNILIISHRGPDPDTIGSNLALRYYLGKQSKNIHSVCIDPLPENAKFLKEATYFLSNFNLENFDTIISVDCGSKSQVAFESLYPDLFTSGKPFINIDHHVSNDNFGSINIVELNLSSTCEIIYRIFKEWQEPITPEIATALLFGMYYDTGSFMHSNTTAKTLEVAETLLAAGANLSLIIEKLYHNFSEAKFHIWGEALSHLKITKENAASSAITIKDLAKNKAKYNDLSGVIDYISMAKGSNYGILVGEDGKGNLKGSLRTRFDNINLSELAGQFGGGGHRKASGFSVKGSILKESFWEIIPTQD